MSQRSPMNKRNQPGAERKGMARKSASSAKPVREAAGSVRVVPASSKERRKQLERGENLNGLSKEEKRARRAERRELEDRIETCVNYLLKEQPLYQSRRKMYWGLLVVAGVGFVGALITLGVVNAGLTAVPIEVLSLVFVGVAYAGLIGALIYDFVRIRPIRNEVRATVEGMSDNRMAAVLERAAEDAAKKREAKKKRG